MLLVLVSEERKLRPMGEKGLILSFSAGEAQVQTT